MIQPSNTRIIDLSGGLLDDTDACSRKNRREAEAWSISPRADQVGGIGLAPGGNVGDIHAIFEAVHGTAPKYAGMDVANPTSLLLSGSMMLTYIGWKEASDILERAIMESYKDRKVTQDVARLMNIKPLKCSEFGLEVMKRMTRPQE